MIHIQHNNEYYLIYKEGDSLEELACSDYNAGISEHVYNIVEVLDACGIEYTVSAL